MNDLQKRNRRVIAFSILRLLMSALFAFVVTGGYEGGIRLFNFGILFFWMIVTILTEQNSSFEIGKLSGCSEAIKTLVEEIDLREKGMMLKSIPRRIRERCETKTRTIFFTEIEHPEYPEPQVEKHCTCTACVSGCECWCHKETAV